MSTPAPGIPAPHPAQARRDASRPRLQAIAGPTFGEFLLGLGVAIAGLWMASRTSDAAAGASGLSVQVFESQAVPFRVLAIGLGVLVTQTLGAGRPDQAARVARLALGAGTWAGLAALMRMGLATRVTRDLLNAPAAVRPVADPLLRLLAPVLLLEAYDLGMAPIVRAHLHARESLRFMVAMHLTHLALALPLMLGVGRWDGLALAGFAWAMGASRGIGLLLHLSLWRDKMQIVPQRRDWWAVPRPVLRIGLPGAAVEVACRAGFMLSLAATASLGAAALATHAYTLQLLEFVLLVSLAIGWACEIMVGRMVGAGAFRAADHLVRKGLRYGLVASGACALSMAVAGPVALRVFTHDAAVINAAWTLLWLSLALETGRALNLMLTGALRAAGDVVVPAAGSMASMALVMGGGAVLLGPILGLPGICIAYALDEWARGALLVWRWYGRAWIPTARFARRAVGPRQ
jgi:Na+-driven multidrug efflux pump